MKRKIVSFLVMGLFLSSAAAADRSGPAEDNTRVTMEAVTVTATKRSGTAKEFPGSISVKDDVFLESRGIQDLGRMVGFTPNVFMKNTSSGGSFVCRGISTFDTALFSPMGLYVNDVAFPMGYMVNQELFDVERVEVLRGPQATLYGRNSASGVINVVLKEPGNRRENRVQVETGSHRTARFNGSARGPVMKDRLFYGLSLQGYTTDGYWENRKTGQEDVAGEESWNGRGTLRFTPTPECTVSVSADGARRDLGISSLRFEEGPFATRRHEVFVNGEDLAHERESGQSARIRYLFPQMEMTSVTSHRIFDRDHRFDFDRSPAPLGHSEMETKMDNWSQEFRLASGDASALSWLVGFYGRYEKMDAGIDFNHVLPGIRSGRSGDSEDTGYAGFGQVTFALTDTLRFTGGLRLDTAENSGEGSFRSQSGLVSFTEDVHTEEWLPMASLACDVSSHVTAYTTFSKGFLAGGFNFFSATAKENFAFDAEHSTNYEAGIKSTWLNRKLTANATVFYTRITDKQIREEVPGAGMGVWQFTNAAQAHTQGVELEAKYQVLPAMELSASFGYADAEVDEWRTTVRGQAVDYSGNKLPWAPEYTCQVGAMYTRSDGYFVLADFLGTGKQYFDAANDLEDDSYGTMNLRAGYEGESFSFSIWCDNLSDETYAVKKVKNGAGIAMVEDGAPRTYGCTCNWRF